MIHRCIIINFQRCDTLMSHCNCYGLLRFFMTQPQHPKESTARPDARVERSQRAILDAARVQLLYNPDASLSDIAQRAGVGRATLYRLYETREDLLLAVGMDCLDAFDRATRHIEDQALGIPHAFQLLFEAVLPLQEEYQFLSRLGDAEDYPAELRAMYWRQQREMIELIREAKQAGKIKQRHPDEWLALLIEAQIFAAQSLMNHQDYTAKQAAEAACKALFEGVR